MAGITNGETDIDFYMSGKDIKSISKGEYTQSVDNISVDNILTPIFDNLERWLAQGCNDFYEQDYDKITYHGQIDTINKFDTWELKKYLFCNTDKNYIELQIENIRDDKEYFISLSILNMLISNVSNMQQIKYCKNKIQQYESEEKKKNNDHLRKNKGKKLEITRKKTIYNNITSKQTSTKTVDIVYIRKLQIINYVETILDNFIENPGIERLRARFFTLVMQFMNLHDEINEKGRRKELKSELNNKRYKPNKKDQASDRKKLKLLGVDMMICFNNISLAMKRMKSVYKPYCDITNMKQVFPQFERKKIKINGEEKEITISKYMFQNVKFKSIFLRMLAYQNSKKYWDMWLTNYTGCDVKIDVNMKEALKFQNSSCAMECNSGEGKDNTSCFITSIFKICSYASNFFTSVVMVQILLAMLSGPLFITYLISIIVLLIVSLVCIIKFFEYLKQIIDFVRSGLLKNAISHNTIKTIFTTTYGLSTLASVIVSVMIACAIPTAPLGVQLLNKIASTIAVPKIISLSFSGIQQIVDKIFTRKWHLEIFNRSHKRYDNFVSCSKKTNSEIIKDKLTNATWINDKISKGTLALNTLVEDIPSETIDGLILYSSCVITGIALLSILSPLKRIRDHNIQIKKEIERVIEKENKKEQLTNIISKKYDKFEIINEDTSITYENLFLLMIEYYDEDFSEYKKNHEQTDLSKMKKIFNKIISDNKKNGEQKDSGDINYEQKDLVNIKTIIDNQDYGYRYKILLNDDQYTLILQNQIINFWKERTSEGKKEQDKDITEQDEGKKEQDEDDIVLRF